MSKKCPKCGSERIQIHPRWIQCFACTTDLDIDETDEIEDALDAMTKRAVKAEAELLTVCGKIAPADMAAWIEEFSSCHVCGLDLLGFADRPASILCEDCEARAAAKEQ